MARGGKGLVYQPQFKQTAIELAMSSSKPMSETAKELGVHPIECMPICTSIIRHLEHH